MLSLEHLENASEADRNDSNGLYYWAGLFAATSWEELKMIAEENPRMQSFVGTIRELTADEQVAMACESRRRYSIDKASYEYEVKMAKQEAESAKQEAEISKQELESVKKELEELKRLISAK